LHEARDFVYFPPVAVPTLERIPLDAPAIALYAASFVAIVLAARARPAYVPAILVALVPFAFYHDVGATTISLSKVALAAAILGLALGKRSLSPLRDGSARLLLVCAALVTAATALSLWPALYRGAALRETLKSLEYLLLFATVVVAFRSEPDERPVRLALAGSAAVVSLLALAQYLTGAPSGIWFMNVPIPRIAGPLEGPNQLAGYLGIALALVTAFVCTRRQVLAETAVLGLGSVALVLTISRAGVFAGLLGIAIVLLLAGGQERRAVIVALSGGVLAGVAILGAWGVAIAHSGLGLHFLERFATAAEDPNSGEVGTRSQLWRAAWILWRRSPLLGIGAGNYELELGRAGYPKLHTHANSLYIQALVEGGVPLLLSTLALVAASIARFARGPFREPLVLGVFAASVGFALHQVFDLLVFYPKVGELWWIALGLGAARLDMLASARTVHASAA